MSNKKLPLFFRPYFWDVDFRNLNLEKDSEFVIERILEQGDKKTLRWLAKNVSVNFFKKTVINSRFLSPKSANFWSLILGFNQREKLCLKKLCPRKLSKIWQS